MLELRNLSKSYPTRSGSRRLFRGLNLRLAPGEKLALLGPNGVGKSTLLGMIAGTVKPSEGLILRRGSVSWPMGFAGSFANDLTGLQNIRFVARIYGADTDALVAAVEDFAELGAFLRMPVRTYSAGMRARLAFGLSVSLSFDWYLVDEIVAVGDTQFRQKSLDVFRDRLSQAGLIMVSHSPQILRDYCTSGLVLDRGHARYYTKIEEAIRDHEAAMG